MKKFDEVQSVNDLSYADYLDYNSMISAKKQKLVGKKEILYLLPMALGLGSLRLINISLLFLLFSIPTICVGAFFTAVSAHSIHINFCKKSDAKAKIIEFNRLKKANKLEDTANLFANFEKTNKFGEEKLKYDISLLKSQISSLKSSKDYSNLNNLEQELKEKEYLLNLINKQKTTPTHKTKNISKTSTEMNINL